MSIDLLLVLAAFGCLLSLLAIAAIRGRRPHAQGPCAGQRSARFVPHWKMMLMLGIAALGVAAAFVIPLLFR